ncbi:TPA: transcriptional regulator [Salmonella enterica subsp. enterica serovar Muenchen]
MNLKSYTKKQRGRSAILGRVLSVPPVLISQWANGVRQIPAERCPEIEKATGGAVTCEELRPDVDWSYLRGTATHPINQDTDAA